MKLFNWNDKEAIEKLREQKRELEKYKVKNLDIPVIEDLLGSLSLGKLYCAIAGTGIGKSTFLLSTAKKIAEQAPVLYITTEENTLQLLDYLDYSNFYTIETEDFAADWSKIKLLITEMNIHYVFYDYMGSTGNFEWEKLKQEANVLALAATELNCLVFTASQATPEMNNLDPYDVRFRSTQFVAFSKHIIDKCSGAIYLCKDENDSIFARTLKNRDYPVNPKPIYIELDYQNRVWRPHYHDTELFDIRNFHTKSSVD